MLFFYVINNYYQKQIGKFRKLHLSRVMTKPVFGVSDQVQHEPGCTTTEDG